MNQADILSRLEDLLVKNIPSAVERLRMKEPVYSLRIWYFGSDVVGDRTPALMIPTDALRQSIFIE